MNIRKLKSAMALKGFSAEKLARKIGISKSAIYRKMRGASDFTLREIREICAALDLETPKDIFFD